MIQKTEVINVEFFYKPHQIQIPVDSVKTLFDLKVELKKITFIQQQDQKLLINRQIIDKNDSQLLSDIKIKPSDRIQLLTKRPKTLSQYQQMRESSKLSIKKPKKHCIEASSLTKNHIKCITKNIFSMKTWKSRDQVLLSQKGFLKFVLQKIGKQNSAFKDLFVNYEKQIAAIILEQDLCPITQQIYNLQKTYDQKLYEKLIKLKYDPNKAIQALDRSQNNFRDALDILSKGKDEVCNETDEVLVVFRWLTCKKNKPLRLQLSLGQQQFWKYLNSLRYRCPQLFKIMSRQRNFALRILKREIHELQKQENQITEPTHVSQPQKR